MSRKSTGNRVNRESHAHPLALEQFGEVMHGMLCTGNGHTVSWNDHDITGIGEFLRKGLNIGLCMWALVHDFRGAALPPACQSRRKSRSKWTDSWLCT